MTQETEGLSGCPRSTVVEYSSCIFRIAAGPTLYLITLIETEPFPVFLVHRQPDCLCITNLAITQGIERSGADISPSPAERYRSH